MLFEWPLHPEVSVEALIRGGRIASSLPGKSSRIPVRFLYGNEDWMDRVGAVRLIQDGVPDVSLRIINDCGHQMIFDQPDIVASEIILFEKAQRSPEARAMLGLPGILESSLEP